MLFSEKTPWILYEFMFRYLNNTDGRTSSPFISGEVQLSHLIYQKITAKERIRTKCHWLAVISNRFVQHSFSGLSIGFLWSENQLNLKRRTSLKPGICPLDYTGWLPRLYTHVQEIKMYTLLTNPAIYWNYTILYFATSDCLCWSDLYQLGVYGYLYKDVSLSQTMKAVVTKMKKLLALLPTKGKLLWFRYVDLAYKT